MKNPSRLFSPERIYYNRKTKKIGNSLTEVYDGNPISANGLKFYLEMGYVPGSGTLFEDIEVLRNYTDIELKDGELKLDGKLNLEDLIDPGQHDGKTKTELITEGGQLFNTVISDLYSDSDKQVILPLTSGLDSRMILGGLLNCTEAKHITTFTWGLPNTLDFEVSKKITNKLGIKHHALNISKYKLTEERLRGFADTSDCSVTLFDHWPVDWVKKIIDESNGIIWMGLLGGSLSGSNLPKSFAENPYVSFYKGNNRIPSISSLCASLINTKPTIEDLRAQASDFKAVNYDTLDIYFHHEDLISPTKLHRGFDYILPFTDPRLLSFFLSLPIQYRINRTLLRDIILSHYPELASFPSNRNGGLGLNVQGKRKTITRKYQKLIGSKGRLGRSGKYISLKSHIEQDKDLRELVESKLKRLEERGLVDKNNLIQLKNEFYGKGNVKIDHSRAIDALVSLEIILELVNYKVSSTSH